jgi:hypothetical protein
MKNNKAMFNLKSSNQEYTYVNMTILVDVQVEFKLFMENDNNDLFEFELLSKKGVSYTFRIGNDLIKHSEISIDNLFLEIDSQKIKVNGVNINTRNVYCSKNYRLRYKV